MEQRVSEEVMGGTKSTHKGVGAHPHRDATGTGSRLVGTSFFRPAGLEISFMFSWIFGQFLQKRRVEVLCFACEISSVDVCDKVY